MRFCIIIYDYLDSTLFMLLFFEPLSITFDTLQVFFSDFPSFSLICRSLIDNFCPLTLGSLSASLYICDGFTILSGQLWCGKF